MQNKNTEAPFFIANERSELKGEDREAAALQSRVRKYRTAGEKNPELSREK